MSYELPVVLRHMYPDVEFGEDVLLQDDGKGPYIRRWSRVEREPTLAEIEAAAPAANAALQAEEAKRIESTTARDDAKRAIEHLDTIIAGAPTATTAQLRAGMEQLARIQKHIILATVGR